MKKGLELFGDHPLAEFQSNYRHRIEEAIAKKQLEREPWWTESIAVGREGFVKEIANQILHRRSLDPHREENGSWVLRDSSPVPVTEDSTECRQARAAYVRKMRAKTGCKAGN